MAERSGLSRSTIGRIWKAFHLKPHVAGTFKLSSDPLFGEKGRCGRCGWPMWTWGCAACG